MKKVVITGCNGYIGKKLAEYLLKQNKEVIGLDIGDGSSLTEYKKFKYIKFGLNDESIEIVRAFQPSVLYHFAWCGVSTIDKNDPSKQFKNLEITYNMLELARLAGIKKVIVPGSVSEFSGSNKPITGYEPDSPSDLYAATKVAVRKLAFYYCKKHSIYLNWLLITSICGSERNDANLITTTIDNLLNDKEVLTTSLKQKWDYLYIDDLINALVTIGDKGEKYCIYPVGSGDIHELSYYVKFISETMKKPDLIKIGVLPHKNKCIDNSIVDISKLTKLGFAPKSLFNDFIIKIINDRRNKQNGQ